NAEPSTQCRVASTQIQPLPDLRAIGGGQIHLDSGLHVERWLPGVDVADRSRPPLIGGMRVTRNLRSKGGVARLIDMRLCICDEELLVGCEAVLLGCVLARSGSVVAVISGGQSRDISDVL